MIEYNSKITESEKPWLAVSGGVDSMAALSFLTKGKSRIRGVIHIYHGTAYSKKAYGLVIKYCLDQGLVFEFHKVEGSSEEEWRLARQKIFHQYPLVYTAHHLGDVVEWWLMTSFRGNPKVMPWKTGNVVHPFLKTSKEEFYDWCKTYKVPFLEDPTNHDGSNDRSKVRAMVPQILDLYPGLYTSIRKKLE